MKHAWSVAGGITRCLGCGVVASVDNANGECPAAPPGPESEAKDTPTQELESYIIGTQVVTRDGHVFMHSVESWDGFPPDREKGGWFWLIQKFIRPQDGNQFCRLGAWYWCHHHQMWECPPFPGGLLPAAVVLEAWRIIGELELPDDVGVPIHE